ncbi:uncharacterized protein LOC133901064 isoform X2 [Phragmites australis]|uniref:uncharacterized protein LOC133901064 isoform X2 n=1 Tax=Phragmites australis TaxID=29695 RepID=UPI002D779FC9|nr:uncharacterized protein LOC133901064 isoform X2 [Phragmites australis]
MVVCARGHAASAASLHHRTALSVTAILHVPQSLHLAPPPFHLLPLLSSLHLYKGSPAPPISNTAKYKAPFHPSILTSSHHCKTNLSLSVCLSVCVCVHVRVHVFMCSIFPSHSVIGVSSQAQAEGGGFRSRESRTSMSSGGSLTSPASAVCSRSWSISEDSLRRYVSYASESCIQELLAASDSDRGGGDDDGWKVLAYHNGVEISRRRTGPAHVFRSRWLLHAVSPEQFMAVANAVDAAKWESDQLVEASYIKELGDDLSIIHLKFGDASARRPARRRDLVVYERRQAMDDGTLVVAVASLPKEIAAGLLPPQAAKGGGVGRGLLLQSGWVVEKLVDGDVGSCVVTYVVQLDPAAGWLPRCLVSRLNSKLVMIIDKLKRMAQTTVPAAEGCNAADEV